MSKPGQTSLLLSRNKISLMNSLINRLIFFGFGFILTYSITKYFQLDSLEWVLGTHWQILDLKYLIKDPFHSLIYLHSQPPLLNFLIWIMSLNSFGIYSSFIVVNCLAIAVVSLILFDILFYYLQSNYVSLIITIAYLISPSVLLNISYPFYPVLDTLGYALLVYSFFKIKSNTNFSIKLFAFSICYLSLLRASFSLPGAIVLSAIYIFYIRKHISMKKILSYFFVSYLVILSVPLKNLYLYDFFGNTSWYPINLAMGFSSPEKMTLGTQPEPVDIKKHLPNLTCKHSYGVVDTELTKSNGEPNYNSCLFFEYGKSQLPNIIHGFSLATYIKNVSYSIFQYFNTPESYYFLQNRDKLKNYPFYYDISFVTLHYKYCCGIRLLCLFLIFFSINRLIKTKDPLLFWILTIFFIHFFTHVLIDGAHSRRHVFDIEFIFFILFSLLISQKRIHRD